MLSLSNKFLNPATSNALVLASVNPSTEKSKSLDVECQESKEKDKGAYVFSGKQIAISFTSATSFKTQASYRKKIVELGGIISYILTPRVTCLIADSADSYKVKQALKQDIPVVSPTYIEACYDQLSLLPYKSYYLAEPVATVNFRRGIINTVDKKCRLPTFDPNSLPVWKDGESHIPCEEADYLILRLRLLEKNGVFVICELHQLLHSGETYEFRIQTTSVTAEKVISRLVKLTDRRLASTAFLFEYDSIMKSGKCEEIPLCINVPLAFSHHLPAKTQNFILEKMMRSSELTSTDESLVESIWSEAIGDLTDVLLHPLKSYDRRKAVQAQGVLRELRNSLDNDQKRRDLEKEFYDLIPHSNDRIIEISSLSSVVMKQNLCQLILDMLEVGESSDWNMRPSTVVKYRSLKCFISALKPSSEEFRSIQKLVNSDLIGSDDSFKIANIYVARRPVEISNFESVGNTKMLFHASSPSNFVGILTRGLMMPKILVDDLGGKRSDAGNLGSGIYFASSPSLSIRYSQPMRASHTRLMLLSEVSLGRTYDTKQPMSDLLTAPPDFDSVHGVATDSGAFQMDEYAIYSTRRQFIRYVIEFTLASDVPRAVESVPEVEERDISCLNALEDVVSTDVSRRKIVHGLQSIGEEPMPLKGVHVRAKLMDIVAEVAVMQQYYNPMDEAVEAKFVFPLDETAAVCGFEAFINDRHVIGRIEEKATARRVYREAVSKGHGAYLMDEDEEVPNVFTISIGNLPPKCSVLIKLRYVTELKTENDELTWSLPAAVSPWKEKEGLSTDTQDVTRTVGSGSDLSGVEFTISAAIHMAYSIRQITCATHELRVKKTDRQAVIFSRGPMTETGFHLSILLAEIHVPRMWVEETEDEDLESNQRYACLLSFYPEFSSEPFPVLNVTVLLDCSNSMRGSSMGEAKCVAQFIVQRLIEDRVKCCVNVVRFGTDFEELYPGQRHLTTPVKKEALSFIKTSSAGMGGSQCYTILSSIARLSDASNRGPDVVFLISDGHLQEEETLLQLLSDFPDRLFLFTLGVGETCNKHLMLRLARLGRGYPEFFSSKFKSRWNEKVRCQVMKSRRAALSDVRIEWQQHDTDAPSPMQAPKFITSLFSNERLLVFGFVPHCRQAELKARVGQHEFSTMVSTAELCQTRGKTLHFLTARALIMDWDGGLLADDVIEQETLRRTRKEAIIKMSKTFSVVSPFTSFVAVEERDRFQGKMSEMEFQNVVSKVLMDEAVDCLPYMEWEKTYGEKTKLLYVRCETGKTIGFDIDSSTSVAQLKKRMEDKEGIPPDRQRYNMNGRYMAEDSKPIVDFGDSDFVKFIILPEKEIRRGKADSASGGKKAFKASKVYRDDNWEPSQATSSTSTDEVGAIPMVISRSSEKVDETRKSVRRSEKDYPEVSQEILKPPRFCDTRSDEPIRLVERRMRKSVRRSEVDSPEVSQEIPKPPRFCDTRSDEPIRLVERRMKSLDDESTSIACRLKCLPCDDEVLVLSKRVAEKDAASFFMKRTSENLSEVNELMECLDTKDDRNKWETEEANIRLSAEDTSPKRSACMGGGELDFDADELMELCQMLGDSEHSDSGDSDASISGSPLRKWPDVKLKRFGEADKRPVLEYEEDVMKLQNDSIFIEFDKFIMVVVLRINYQACENILKEAGIESFGSVGAYELRCLFATLLLLYVVFIVYQNADADAEHYDFVDLILNVPVTKLSEIPSRMVSYCRKMIEKYPLSCYHMELGSNWPTFVDDLLK